MLLECRSKIFLFQVIGPPWKVFPHHNIINKMCCNLAGTNILLDMTFIVLQYAMYKTCGVEQIRYDWLATKLSPDSNVSLNGLYWWGTMSVKSCFRLYGLPRPNKSLRFWKLLLVKSIEPFGKMLWRNGKFLIKCKWRLIICDALGPRGLKVDVNITLFSIDFSIFYVLQVLVSEFRFH